MEVRHYYTDDCINKTDKCEFELDVSDTMEPPIFVYYQLDNFYRRNRNFYRSRSVEQLRGITGPDVSDCGDYMTNTQMSIIYLLCRKVAISEQKNTKPR